MFWRQTPRLFELAVAGKGKAAERAQRDRGWLAWHIAAIPKMKRFPRLSEFLGGKPRTTAQTPEQLLAVAVQWHRATTQQR